MRCLFETESASKVIPKDAPPSPLTKGGVVVGMKKEGDKEKIYFIGDDCHLLCVGATRSGKSRCLVLESICLLGLAGESIFCSDPRPNCSSTHRNF